MTHRNDIIISAAQRLGVAFDVPSIEELQVSNDMLGTIRAALVERIIYLLNVNPERLMAILYRIDVSESAMNQIFSKDLPPDMPESIADLVIERQLAKAESRARHREQQ